MKVNKEYARKGERMKAEKQEETEKQNGKNLYFLISFTCRRQMK